MSNKIDGSPQVRKAGLRKMGLLGLAVGLAVIAVVIYLAVTLAPTSEVGTETTASAVHDLVFLAGLGVLGLIETALGAIALVASSRFPRIARFSDANDALGFTAGVLTFGFAVALIVLAASGLAALVVAVLVVVLVTTSMVRKAIAAGEAVASQE